MDKNSLVGPFLSHSPSRVYRGDGAIRFSGEARYKYLHVDILYFFFLVYMPKWFYSIFSLFDYVPRLWKRKKGKWGHMIGTALALYVIGSMLYGAFYARQHPIYNYRTISFPNLPEDFDGYRIVQFSDLHLETLGSAANYLPRWINRINQLHPDLIVFTGDLVNRRGNELPPLHERTFPSLRARWSIFYLGESRLRRLFPLGKPRRKKNKHSVRSSSTRKKWVGRC